MKHGLSRREFLVSSAASAGLLATTGSGCESRWTPYEGIYTDKFTYRQGEWVMVSGALQQPQAAPIKLKSFHTHVVFTLETLTANLPSFGNPDQPGIDGANFWPVAFFNTAELDPGIYEVQIDKSYLLPENRTNNFNNFPSRNWRAKFCVTSPTPGSHSRILWVFDQFTGTAYGSFGGHSIYGNADTDVKQRTVSQLRPGLDRSNLVRKPLTFLRQNGYDFEYIDLHQLSLEAEDYLSVYDLIIITGGFEYVPHDVMMRIESYLDGGGNLIAATNEFASQRVRLDADTRQLTTYKFDFQDLDPLWGTGSPEAAGIGMRMSDSLYETEILGQHMWAAHQAAPGGFVDLPVYNLSEAGWILDGTGIGAGQVLPHAFQSFATGQICQFDTNGQPFIEDPASTRTFEDTIVWAAFPSSAALDWWVADPSVLPWPSISNGYATATLQERPSGARIVSLPTQNMLESNIGNPIFETLLLNLMAAMA